MLTLWTDTYCTLPQANLSRYLVNNRVWAAFTDTQKRQRLKDASELLDRLRYRGVRDSSSQAMSWPRTMSTGRWPAYWFETAYMYNRIAEAVCAQVAYDIHRPGAEVLKGQKFVEKSELAPRAREILRIYVYNIGVNLHEPEYLENPDYGDV